MNLKDTMKARRKFLSISQADLAEMAQLSLATIKDIERGEGNPSIATMTKIMDVLGMEIIFKVRNTISEEL